MRYARPLLAASLSTASALAAGELPSSPLPLTAAGLAVFDKGPVGRGIQEIRGLDGRLYLGTGDGTANTGPTDVVVYDIQTEGWKAEFTCDEECIDRFRIVDGQLAIPGADATENWEFGNIYAKEKEGWSKRRTLPHAVHVLDVASFDGAWFAGTATLPGKGVQVGSAAKVFRSADRGRTWESVLKIGGEDSIHRRAHHLIPFQGRLYAFFYAYGGARVGEIPEGIRPGGAPPEGIVAVYLPPLEGESDLMVLDAEGRWQARRLFPDSRLLYVRNALAFKDRLLLNGLLGERFYAGVPASGKPVFCAFDGSSASPVSSFPLTDIADMEVCGDRLVCLGTAQGRWRIATTEDLVRWDVRTVPPFITPLSVWGEKGRIYLGGADGVLWAEEPLTGPDATRYAANPLPRRTVAGGLTPEEAAGPWSAITDWTAWGRPARLEARIASGNRIEAASDNVAACSFFFPHPFLDADAPVSVFLDGKEAYRGPAQGGELRIERGATGGWQTSWKETSREAWRPEPKAFFSLGRPVPHDPAGESPLADWVADAFQEAAGADIALVNNGGLKVKSLSGDVSLMSLWELHHRGDLLVLEASGRDLVEMLRLNQAAWRETRCRISGFRMTCRPVSGKDAWEMLEAGLEPERRYRVAVPDYMVRKAQRFFGRPVAAKPSGITAFEALVRKSERSQAPSPAPDGRLRIIR